MFAYGEAAGTEPTCITSFRIMRRLVRHRRQINGGERCCRCEGGRLNHSPPLLQAAGGGTSCQSESLPVVKSPASSESTNSPNTLSFYRCQAFSRSLEIKTLKLTSCSSKACGSRVAYNVELSIVNLFGWIGPDRWCKSKTTARFYCQTSASQTVKCFPLNWSSELKQIIYQYTPNVFSLTMQQLLLNHLGTKPRVSAIKRFDLAGFHLVQWQFSVLSF